MKTFTIENETNNITIHATKQEAQTVPDAERFDTEAALATLAALWPTSRLVEIWNSLPGETPVKKFKDRATAISRIWKAIQHLGQTAQDSAAPAEAAVSEPVAPLTPDVATEEAPVSNEATPTAEAKPAATTSKTRESSKTSRVIEMLKREGGVTLKEIMIEMGWQSHTTRALMSAGGTLAKKHGLTVVSTKGSNGDRIYSISA